MMREGVDMGVPRCWEPGDKGCEGRDEDRLFVGAGGNATIGILPVSLFCSGHTYFVQDMPAMIDEVPYAVHATFQFGARPGKRHRFR